MPLPHSCPVRHFEVSTHGAPLVTVTIAEVVDIPMSSLAVTLMSMTGAAGEWLPSFTIVTTSANPMLAPLHERMPVILPKSDYGAWLDPQATPERLQAQLRPSTEALTAVAVSTHVNNARHEGAECVVPV